jgi:hypothetical protein
MLKSEKVNLPQTNQNHKMQKFFRIFIILIFFFACLIAGVYLAGFTNSDTQLTENPIDIENSNQINLLIFVVDQLDVKKPEFHSAWSVILYYPNPKGIVLVPLSSVSENTNNEILRNFKLDSKNFPNKKTIKFNEEKFNTQWDAVIILDLHAVQYFVDWLTERNVTIDPSIQNGGIDALENINNVSTNVCKYLSNHLLPEWENLDLRTISKTHYQSTLTDESLGNFWKVMHAENSPKCEVIQLIEKQN